VRFFLALVLGLAVLSAQPPPAVLFDHTRLEEAGISAEWVICSGSEPDPAPADPDSERQWNGAISSWAFDLHRSGYQVSTLPPWGRITWQDPGNPQDLSRYAVYVLPEPYLYFNAGEKAAILAFVRSGGGLFLVGNHLGATRASGEAPGSTDAFHVFNDLLGEGQGNPFGFTFVAGHGHGDPWADTVSTAFSAADGPAERAILHGPYGNLVDMDFHAYAYLALDPQANPSVRELLATQVPGDRGSFIATCTLGSGRVVAISDSAPMDDGTSTTPHKRLHPSWASHSNRAFFLNATRYLAGAGAPLRTPPPPRRSTGAGTPAPSPGH